MKAAPALRAGPLARSDADADADADAATVSSAPPAPPATTRSAPFTAPAATLRVSSAQLFGHATEIRIDHHGAIYRLKHTSSGKLILTK